MAEEVKAQAILNQINTNLAILTIFSPKILISK
jgi:hypothetical protein